MTGPYGNFPSLLAGPMGMPIDPAEFERLGAEAFAADPQGAGAGPFRLVRWAQNEEMVLEAKDDYWDGPVCLATLRFVRIEANDARYEAFANGEVDVAFIRSAPELAKAREDEASLFGNMSNGGFTLIINNGSFGTDRPAADLRIRQAIAYAIDPEVVDQRATGGQGVPGSALVPETSSLYTDAIVGPPYDPERAKELLDEVKAETGYDGSLKFICNTTYAEAAIAIEGLLESVGFVVDNDSTRSIQDWVAYMTQTQNDYDLTCSSLTMTDTQPWETLDELGQGPNGFMGYVNADMDAAMAVLREAATLEEKQEALVGVQEVWNETVPSAVYGHVEEGVVWSDDVEGIEFTSETIALLDEARVAG
jgi:peptide/nickel transport system substrate-binding protein